MRFMVLVKATKDSEAGVLPDQTLALADALTAEATLQTYHLLATVRGDLLAKLGWDEARAEFERAASLTRNRRERELLLGRAAVYVRGAEPSR